MGGPSLRDLGAVVERIQAAYGHTCFACGRDNRIGLHLELVGTEDGWVKARFDPRPEYAGAPETLHGGITATALDEILVWAGIVTENVMTVTGRLEIRYRRPIRVDERIHARGRVDNRSGRRLAVSGALEVGGVVAAEATGLYLVSAGVDDVAPPEHRT
jgi:acyl-coenzyme A thioesterase PaaI-like protein